MYKYIISLKSKLNNKKLRNILYNSYFSLIDLYWNIYYTFWFGVFAGIGNAFHGNANELISLFFQGFINNAYLSIFVNLFYAKFVGIMIKTNHPRLYSNTFGLAVQSAFLLWHYFIGTQNPLQTMVLPVVGGIVLVNYHVTRVLRQIK